MKLLFSILSLLLCFSFTTLGWTQNIHIGTPGSTDLPSDSKPKNPITISFGSSPTTFDDGGTKPQGIGTISIQVPAAPSTNLPNPKITLNGVGITLEQTVNWGEEWKVSYLEEGSYVVTASNMDNGINFYTFTPITVNVTDDSNMLVTVSYTSVPTTPVTAFLINGEGPIETTFTGNKYSLVKSLNEGSVVMLPADSYQIKATKPAYTIIATPNPLITPLHDTLSLTLQKEIPNGTFGGYFESWSSKWTNDPAKADLANLPSYVTYVYLAFAKPDAAYTKGSLNLNGTGLTFSYDGKILKEAIAALHARHPNTKVILSTGGATYNNWNSFQPKAIADIVTDFGLDGVDLDYEASNPGCALGTDKLIHCKIDEAYQNIVQSMRALLPSPYLLVATTWSIAAYGQDKWVNSQPQGAFTGMMLPFFRSAAVKSIDFVNVMSYDASNAYNPIEALAAYSNYYSGPINMGVEVPPESWGGHIYTLAEIRELTQATMTQAKQHNTVPGMMMWSLHKAPNGTPSAINPSAQMIATQICKDLGLSDCEIPLFP